jgi:hypothetical protein
MLRPPISVTRAGGTLRFMTIKTKTVQASWGSQGKIRKLIEQGWKVESTVWGKTILSKQD